MKTIEFAHGNCGLLPSGDLAWFVVNVLPRRLERQRLAVLNDPLLGIIYAEELNIQRMHAEHVIKRCPRIASMQRG